MAPDPRRSPRRNLRCLHLFLISEPSRASDIPHRRRKTLARSGARTRATREGRRALTFGAVCVVSRPSVAFGMCFFDVPNWPIRGLLLDAPNTQITLDLLLQHCSWPVGHDPLSRWLASDGRCFPEF